MFIVIFLFLGAMFIVSEKNLSLLNPDSRVNFVSAYAGWFDQLFGNSKNLVGYVVKLDWMPEK